MPCDLYDRRGGSCSHSICSKYAFWLSKVRDLHRIFRDKGRSAGQPIIHLPALKGIQFWSPSASYSQQDGPASLILFARSDRFHFGIGPQPVRMALPDDQNPHESQFTNSGGRSNAGLPVR